jgi:hypothetical protein
MIITINSHITLARYSILAHHKECTHITYEQYCQMYVLTTEVPANCNTIPSFRQLFHHHHTLLMGILSNVLCPLGCSLVVIDVVIVVRVGKLAIVQKT